MYSRYMFRSLFIGRCAKRPRYSGLVFLVATAGGRCFDIDCLKFLILPDTRSDLPSQQLHGIMAHKFAALVSLRLQPIIFVGIICCVKTCYENCNGIVICCEACE